MLSRHFQKQDGWLLVALYFIVLQFLIITYLTLFFSSFSSPLLSAVFAFSLFVIGNFAEDLRGLPASPRDSSRWLAMGRLPYLVPNFRRSMSSARWLTRSRFPASSFFTTSAYALIYSTMAICGAVLVFERRNLK